MKGVNLYRSRRTTRRTEEEINEINGKYFMQIVEGVTANQDSPCRFSFGYASQPRWSFHISTADSGFE
jgi:hypothetical protein